MWTPKGCSIIKRRLSQSQSSRSRWYILWWLLHRRVKSWKSSWSSAGKAYDDGETIHVGGMKWFPKEHKLVSIIEVLKKTAWEETKQNDWNHSIKINKTTLLFKSWWNLWPDGKTNTNCGVDKDNCNNSFTKNWIEMIRYQMI